MRYLPIFLDISAGTVILVGSGAPALNKLRLLRKAGARVRWYVDNPAIASDADIDQGVTILPMDSFATLELGDVGAVICAAGDPIDEAVATKARLLHIPVNVVDRPELSTFIVPAIVDRGDVVVAIGTGGLAPVLARRLRARIEALLPARIGQLSEWMGRYRERLAAVLPQPGARRRFWESLVDGPIASAILAGQLFKAQTLLDEAISDAARRLDALTEFGSITVLSIGSSDPDLLTLRALNALQDADAVFYDGTISADLLDRARRDAELISIDKTPCATEAMSFEFRAPLLDAARAGRRIVLLRDSDQLMLDCESGLLEYFSDAGVQFVIVPGISKATSITAESLGKTTQEAA